MRSNSVKYFPFSTGIPWQVKCGKYVQPEVSGTILRERLKDKEIVVVALQGLIESFFSLSILETINYMMPGHNLYWSGYPIYYPMIKRNGLAKPFDKYIDHDTLERFPIPIFFDKENRAYFNCLNNYLEVTPYYLGIAGYKDRRPIFKQIAEKSTAPWDVRFTPMLRHADISQEALPMKGRAPHVLIFPERSGLSVHPANGLDWTIDQTRSFCTMLRPEFKPIVVVKNPGQYFNVNAEVIQFSVESVLRLLPGAYAVLSKDVDILLMAFALSNAKILSKPLPAHLSLEKNAKFLLKNNDIYIIESFTPEKAWRNITKLGNV